MALLAMGEWGRLNEWTHGRHEKMKYVHLEELQQRAQRLRTNKKFLVMISDQISDQFQIDEDI